MHCFFGQTQGRKFFSYEVIHGLRTAQEKRAAGEIHVFFHQFPGHKALFAMRLLLIAEDIHHFEMIAAGCQGIQFLAIGQLCCGAGAVKKCHVVIFVPFGKAARHGHKGCDSAAASDTDDIPAVSQGLIVEFTGGFGHDKAVAHLCRFVEITGHKTHVLHCQHQFVFQGLPWCGDNGIGAADQAVPDLDLDGHVLSCPEEGKLSAVHSFEGEFPDGIREGTGVGQFHLHIAGVELFRQGVGAVFLRQRGVGTLSQHLAPGGHHFFEPQHIHKSENLFLEIHSPCASFFKSPTV
ncbi:unknown [Clostridium sp. CAG:1013]|nr:unknown [Clostridium sp. CAG:1013]